MKITTRKEFIQKMYWEGDVIDMVSYYGPINHEFDDIDFKDTWNTFCSLAEDLQDYIDEEDLDDEEEEEGDE